MFRKEKKRENEWMNDLLGTCYLLGTLKWAILSSAETLQIDNVKHA